MVQHIIAKKKTMYECPYCHREYDSKALATKCAKDDLFRHALNKIAIGENENFISEEIDDYDDLDVDEYELEVKPEFAQSVEEVEELLVVEHVHGYHVRRVRRRKIEEGGV